MKEININMREEEKGMEIMKKLSKNSDEYIEYMCRNDNRIKRIKIIMSVCSLILIFDEESKVAKKPLDFKYCKLKSDNYDDIWKKYKSEISENFKIKTKPLKIRNLLNRMLSTVDYKLITFKRLNTDIYMIKLK